MKVLINCVDKKIKPYDSILERTKKHLVSKEGVEVVENKDITKPSDYALIVNIGFDYRIISEVYKFLSKFNAKTTPTKLIFLNPAGDTWYKEFNILTQKAIDEMGCDPSVYDNIEDFWSMHNFEKFFDFFYKAYSAS